MSTENIEMIDAQAIRLSFIEGFVGTLLAPVQTFRQLARECKRDAHQLAPAASIVVLVFAVDALRLTPAGQIGWALFSVPGEVTAGVALWLLSALIVGLLGICFGQEQYRVRAAFVTLGWSLLPWIFMGPLACFGKLLGPVHLLLMALPLVWILVLQIIAVLQSYEMKVWKGLVLLLLLPTLLSWYQMLQFFQSLAATLGSMIGN